MNIWVINKWRKFYGETCERSGLRVIYDADVDPNVKRACKEFFVWLRAQYAFPKRVRIYVKSSIRIKSIHGDMVCGTFFRPYDRNIEPHIRIATGDYQKLVEDEGVDNALAEILWTIAHELTHYFQWLNDLPLTLIGEERQATNYANRILQEYATTRDHP